ncbi:magnesium-chelatase 60 kDa subunit [Luminiphilus syltensis NOR5-1B]|uniref:Magnesium-chelatase 60 kDa subunit n=1 Tax=Luminiphilus syltensis NOR5-1B TaxID=565045 RepID=B8KT14_9GAMM|nr:magnesium chelatase subunit D [Luminiphilus syltensis]EED35711.1 magnesium-chelatase 60 kDa subunit [Luminiphilus syltensis NOR5-1B]
MSDEFSPEPPAQTAWEAAGWAAAAIAVDPINLGGVCLRAAPGPVRDLWLELLRDVSDCDRWRRIPLHISESRLLGGINLAATMNSGKLVGEQGLLSEADGGFVVLAMAERAERNTIAHLCHGLDTGEIIVEREGLRDKVSARFAVIALDEGLPDEHLSRALADRLALHVDLHSVSIRDITPLPFDVDDVLNARHRLPDVVMDDRQIEALASTAAALGIDSTRILILGSRLARTCAALSDREAVNELDLQRVITLLLLHHATQIPASDDVAEPAPEQPPPVEEPEQADADEPPASEQAQDEEAQSPETEPDDPVPLEALSEQLLEASTAVLPAEMLGQLLLRNQPSRRQSLHAGKSGATQRSKQRGRPIGVKPGNPKSGEKLNLVATLRTAAPWQRLRQQQRDGLNTGTNIAIETSDFRVVRYRQRSASTTVFVVDASGSAALHRLAEAKGAVELLLAECYVRRDQVALIAFRGTEAELLLPPTRSLVRAKRSLAELPGGGGTPLASALRLLDTVTEQIASHGGTPHYVLLTDGRANIGLSGEPGREQASQDAEQTASHLRKRQLRGIVIDTSSRPSYRAEELAGHLGAIYAPLPQANASDLQRVIQAVTS